MANKEQIHDFAVKWLGKYNNTNTTIHEVEENFAAECFAIGFEMDCGKAFENTYPDSNAFNNYTNLNNIINRITDVYLLGSAIFSKWRYITYWSNDDLLSTENRPWFIIAFSRLAILTAVNGSI